MQARSFLKWAGSKRWAVDTILSHIGPHVLARRGRYFEPFMGGAALFWALRSMGQSDAVLSDANAELVNMYRAVRDDVEKVIRHLSAMQERYHDSSPEQRAAFYYEVRDARESSAARTIFLNKTGFNGLYRVNKCGGFNVPHGRTASGAPPVICDAENLRACSAALQGVLIGEADFRGVLTGSYGMFGESFRLPRPEEGDLVYLDPPYEPEPGKASFTAYTAGGAGETLQEDVARAFRGLAARGVYVVASNSATPKIRELYSGFRQVEIARPGGMSSKTSGRQPVPELLILGWT